MMTANEPGFAVYARVDERTPESDTNTYTSARAAILGYLQLWEPLELADILDVDNSHIYRARKGDMTDTLRQALIDFGAIPPPKGRYRRAADLHTAERAAQFDAMISERDTSLTEWMNKELDEWLDS